MGNAASPARRLISELRRRRLFRTAALYVVGTWLVLQVADVVFPAMDIPERAIRYLLIAALLGFPAALIFGWFYDIGTHGIRRTGPAEAGELDAALSLRRSDYLILTALAGVAALILYGAVDKVIEAPREIRATPREGPPMVAVLPFVSKSLGGDGEFFATGVHDDLLTQLAQLQSIRVISRTSVLEYRDTVANIREIGSELGADAILEGGVQSAGDRIRINAQLIDARTDEHMWAQTYDRELSPANIFEVQSEIARAITSAMQANLTEHDATQLKVLPTENMAAYRAYHRAMKLGKNQSTFQNKTYQQALEEAVALDPTFTRAWVELVGLFSHWNFYVEVSPELIQRSEEILEKIRKLAPDSADYLMAQAYFTYYTLKDYDRAYQLVTQAQDMMPSDVRLVDLKSWIQRRQGNFEARIESLGLARTLDPRNPQRTVILIKNLMLTHRYDDARQELENSTFQEFMLSYWHNMLQLREHRDFDRWAEDLAALEKEFGGDADPEVMWAAHIAARNYTAAEKMLSTLRDPREGGRESWPVLSPFKAARIITYWFLRQNDRLSEFLIQARKHLEKGRNSDGGFEFNFFYFDLALVAGAEGNTEESERLIRRWRRGEKDMAELALESHNACQILGRAGTAVAAAECIRKSLVEPSMVFPFFEPFLPHYDSIRDEPVFVELLADLGAAAIDP